MSSIKPLIIKAESYQQGCQAQIIKNFLVNGELVAFPTETVYGVGGDAFSDGAIQKLIAVKKRPANSPFSLQIGSIEQGEKYVEIDNSRIYQLMEAFWPGPLTIILKSKPEVPLVLRGNLPTVGLRFPLHQAAIKLALDLGRPLAATSANLSGRPSPTLVGHVIADLGPHIKAVIDDGPSLWGIESTVLDLAGEEAVVLREGAVGISEISEILKTTVLKGSQIQKKHYQPSCPLYIMGSYDFVYWQQYFKKQGYAKIGLIASRINEAQQADQAYILTSDTKGLKNFYNILRSLEQQVDLILAEYPEEGPYQKLLLARLIKASSAVLN